MTTWGTTAKSNFDMVSKVQNQALLFRTGEERTLRVQASLPATR